MTYKSILFLWGAHWILLFVIGISVWADVPTTNVSSSPNSMVSESVLVVLPDRPAGVITNVSEAREEPAWIRGTRDNGGAGGVELQKGVNPLRSILSLAVILAVLFGLNRLIRGKLHGSKGGVGGGSDLVVVSRRKLGARQELVAVVFGGKTLLLGVTPEQITCLDQAIVPEVKVGVMSGEQSGGHDAVRS